MRLSEHIQALQIKRSFKWIWYPSNRGRIFSSLCTIGMYAVLGTGGIPRFPSIATFVATPLKISEALAWCAALTIVNFVLIFGHVRSDFASLKAAVRAIFITTIVFSLFFTLVTLAFDFTESGFWPGSAYTYLTQLALVKVVNIVTLGLGGLTLTLMVSGLWKPTGVDLDRVTLLSRRAEHYLNFLLRSPSDVESVLRSQVEKATFALQALRSGLEDIVLDLDNPQRTIDLVTSIAYTIDRITGKPTTYFRNKDWKIDVRFCNFVGNC